MGFKLPEEKRNRVRELLLEKTLSRRKISEMTGVSRTKISQIERDIFDELYSKQSEVIVFPPFDGPIVRCETCGGMVRQPCLKCQLDARKAI